MLLDNGGDNFPLCLYLCQLLKNLYLPYNFDAILDSVQSLTGRSCQVNSIQQPNVPVTACVVTSGTYRLILFAGTDTLSQGVQLVSSWVGTPLQSFVDPDNAFLQNAAASVVNLVQGNRDPATQTTIIAGHSLGGATAMEYLRQNPTTPTTTKRTVITFGAPRPFGVSGRAAVSNQPIWRWFTPDDPVPLLPWRLNDVPAIAFLLPALAVLRCGNFVHPGLGLQVNNDGTLTFSALPTGSVATPVGNMATWLYSLATDATSAHHLNSYISNFTALINNSVFAQPPVLEAEVPDGPVGGHRQDVTKQEAKTTRAIFQAGEIQDVSKVNIPPALQFKAVRQGKIWLVQFQGQTFGISPTKRRARHLARVGNELLRSLSREAVVDTDALDSLFSQYLSAAASPGSGVVPTINTVVPPG